MKVLAWNIRHGGGKRLSRIAASILSHAPDVIVLSEFRSVPGVELENLLAAGGYGHFHAGPLEPRKNGVAIASRWAVVACTGSPPFEVPSHRWVEAAIPELGITVAGFYGPLENESYMEWWNSVRTAVESRIQQPFLLAGDFNTGMSVVDAPRDPFYCSDHFYALQQLGMTDAWRFRNADAREYSWYSRRGGKDLNGFRLDHILTSPALSARIAGATYSHDERLAGTSDHSALLVEFE